MPWRHFPRASGAPRAPSSQAPGFRQLWLFFVGGQSSSVTHFTRSEFRNFCNALSPSFWPLVLLDRLHDGGGAAEVDGRAGDFFYLAGVDLGSHGYVFWARDGPALRRGARAVDPAREGGGAFKLRVGVRRRARGR